MRRRLICCLLLLLLSTAVFAQQVGSIGGRVTATDGSVLPGVTVEAKSNVLPQPRVTVTDSQGDYSLPALVPGNYTVTYTLSGMQTATRKAQVLLSQNTAVDVKLGVAGVSEEVTVTAHATLVDKESTEIHAGLSSNEIQMLPIAHDYRDMQKMIPGVMYTQDLVRGPSAGGSGQDNVYLFDGVNVTMPLFGVLVSEPDTHDVAQFNVIRGGAKAVDFDRAGGILIDSVSKSGTNKLTGELSYQLRSHDFVAHQKGTVAATYLQDRDWTTINAGGPILADRLFFYGSYFRPDYTKSNQANLYGELPEYHSKRNEEFGKMTYTPTASLLLNGSYRYSHRVDTSGDAFGTRAAGTTGTGYETKLQIGTLEGSWIVNPQSFGTFKFTDFRNPGFGRPDNVANTTVSTAPGTHLPIDQLDQIGLLTVPTVIGTNATQAAFVQPFIDKYGYVLNGVRTGGGTVGFGSLLHDDDSFFRKNGQVGYNYTVGSTISHDLHVGYQRYTDAEDLFRDSNGWGSITIPGSSVNCPAAACGTAKPAYFIATFQQQTGTLGLVPKIHSEYHSQNVELNDTIHMSNWTFNLGVMASNDTLYGQGLAKANNVAGFVRSPGTKYKMHSTPFSDMIQPRLGSTWAYNGSDTVFASYARYNPAANSDARAASWDRNLVNTIQVYFDQSGNLMGVDPVRSSSGKLFQAGIKPPQINEYMLGTSQQITNAWSARLYGRYRHGDHFWEDTRNNERICANPSSALLGQCPANFIPSDAPSNIPRQPYIADLPAKLAAIGSGSTYVIAELDGAFTKYYEATAESEWHGTNTFVRGSYTWSHYYGNFDQDNTSPNTSNDAARFIGSSNIGDGVGRQLWNYKYGDFRGDRRHMVKLTGTYTLPWHATTGAVMLYQSGQPYQLESFLPYASLTTSTSDTNRYAEPAGRRRTPGHSQVDFNYTQNVPLPRSLNLQLAVDVFNLNNSQSGYNFESRIGSLGKCTTSHCIDTGIAAQPSVNAPFPLSFYSPRLYQIAARVQF